MFFKNVLWSLSGTVGVRLIGFITSIFLARILAPDVFGLVSMALVFVGFVYVVQEAGLSSVLIQKKEINKTLIATTFYLNIILSMMLSVTIILMAPMISGFYGQPEVESLLQYSSLGIIIASLGITQRALLTRERKFKTLTFIDMIAEIITGLGAIVLAFSGFPIFAVGLSMLFRPAIQTICTIAVVRYSNVIGVPSKLLIKEVLPYSLNVLGVRVLNFVKNNIDYLLIGNLLGSTSLGLYTIAFQWSTIARFYFSQSIAKVTFPEISRNQNDLNKVSRIYIGVLKKISFFTFPLCLGLVAVSEEFITILYSDQWLEVVSVLNVLMIAGMISSVGTTVGAFLRGIGRPDVEFKVNVISLVSFTILIYLCSSFGIIGVSYAVLINTIVFDVVMAKKVISILQLKFSEYLNSLSKALISSFMMFFVLFVLSHVNMEYISIYLRFFMFVIIGIIAYIVFSRLFNKEVFDWALGKFLRIFHLKSLEHGIYKKKDI